VPERKARSQPAWTDIKAKLAGFDRRGLISLIQDLYAAHKENRTLLDQIFSGGRPAPSGKHHKWDKLFLTVKPPDATRVEHRHPTYAPLPKTHAR
jgi:hypothetical protein